MWFLHSNLSILGGFVEHLLWVFLSRGSHWILYYTYITWWEPTENQHLSSSKPLSVGVWLHFPSKHIVTHFSVQSLIWSTEIEFKDILTHDVIATARAFVWPVYHGETVVACLTIYYCFLLFRILKRCSVQSTNLVPICCLSEFAVKGPDRHRRACGGLQSAVWQWPSRWVGLFSLFFGFFCFVIFFAKPK